MIKETSKLSTKNTRCRKIYEKQKKNDWVWDPYFLITYTHKNAHMKIFHVYPGEKFRFFKFTYVLENAVVLT